MCFACSQNIGWWVPTKTRLESSESLLRPVPVLTEFVIDLRNVPAGESISAIRYAAGPVDPELEQCPIVSIGQAGKGLRLPATHFFARITKAGRCKYFATQSCGRHDETCSRSARNSICLQTRTINFIQTKPV